MVTFSKLAQKASLFLSCGFGASAAAEVRICGEHERQKRRTSTTAASAGFLIHPAPLIEFQRKTNF